MADWAAAAAAWAQSGEGEKNVFIPPPPPPQGNQQHGMWAGGDAHPSQQQAWMPHPMEPSPHQPQHGFGHAGVSDPTAAVGFQGPPGGAQFGHGGEQRNA